MDENNRIIIRRVSRHQKDGAPEEETMHIFHAGAGRSGNWLIYLLLIPVFIVMAVLGIFFFTAFFALFAVAGIGLGFRLWWLRRKLRKSMEEEEAQYSVIEDAEIVEERTDRVNEPSPRDRQ